jgi:putative oxidoreductase
MDSSYFSEYASLLARICLAAVFLWSGVGKLVDWKDGRAEIVALGLPVPSLDLAATIVCQIAGGLMVLLGLWTKLGAWLLLAFTFFATLLGHRVHSLSAAKDQRELTTIFEHLAIIGGFLMLVINGPGRLSLDHLFY